MAIVYQGRKWFWVDTQFDEDFIYDIYEDNYGNQIKKIVQCRQGVKKMGFIEQEQVKIKINPTFSKQVEKWLVEQGYEKRTSYNGILYSKGSLNLNVDSNGEFEAYVIRTILKLDKDNKVLGGRFGLEETNYETATTEFVSAIIQAREDFTKFWETWVVDNE